MQYFKHLSISFAILYFFFINCSYAQIKTLGGIELSEKKLDLFIHQKMDSLHLIGLSIAVINDGKIVYNKASGIANKKTGIKVDSQTLFEAASMSKPVFAYFVMKIVEKGLLDLDKPLFQYLELTDISDERSKLITARMVLTHTSGLPNWRRMNSDGKLNIKFTPGTQFEYSGEGYEYLVRVITHLSGTKNLDSVFQQEVSGPLGLKHFSFTNNPYLLKHISSPHVADTLAPIDESMDRTSFSAAGGLRTEAVEYARFLISLMNEKGLQKESYRELFTEQVNLPEDNIIRQYTGYTRWTLGFAEKDSPSGKLILHAGNNWGFQSAFIIQKEHKSGYVFLTNCDRGNEFSKELEALFTSKAEKK